MHLRTSIANTRTKELLLLAIFTASVSTIGLCQVAVRLRADRIEATVQKVTANPDDADDLHVHVLVTIYAGSQPLVIPSCADQPVKDGYFCLAQLARANGRIIPVRNRLMATLGVEPPEKWKPVLIAPQTTATFRFNFSTRLLDVRAGEAVRIKFSAWPDAQSVNDGKSATTLLSPLFRCPSKSS